MKQEKFPLFKRIGKKVQIVGELIVNDIEIRVVLLRELPERERQFLKSRADEFKQFLGNFWRKSSWDKLAWISASFSLCDENGKIIIGPPLPDSIGDPDQYWA